MKTIRDLIEKYEKEIEKIEVDMLIDDREEYQEPYCTEISLRQLFLQDLKEYEKSILFDKISEMGPEVEQEQNYPPLRERLICSIATGFMASNPIDLHGNCNLPVSRDYAMNVVSYADEIIKQLNQEK